MEGKVAWFNVAKGYGEVVGDDDQRYMFTYDEIQTKEKFRKVAKDTLVKFHPSPETTFNLPTAKKVKPQ